MTMKCDPVTGACQLPDLPVVNQVRAPHLQDMAVHYVGDPMCSWCWGIAPTVQRVAEFCAAEGIAFSVTVGGLRAGGGDPWNEPFKHFLRGEWEHIAGVTGQPFGFTLLQAQHFDYDTEPACRAVVAARTLVLRQALPATTELAFFAATQQRFYVQGEDPKQVEFYRPVCAQTGLPFEDFRVLFESPEMREAVNREFAQCRQWGVRSFPTILLRRGQQTRSVAAGFVTAQTVVDRLRDMLAVPVDPTAA